jgi:cephalosporin-C deacetylase-like acetyl esterase
MRNLLPLLIVLLFATASRADELNVLPDDLPDGPRAQMFHRYLLAQAIELLDEREKAFEKIKTPEDIEAHQKMLKNRFNSELGGFPRRTPLNAKVTGTDDHDGYTVEKVLFESQPKHYVTALLYLPKTATPHPAIIVPCGHSANGKAAETYQRACILMAKNGIAAFCYDPTGQGERLQIRKEDGSAYGSTTEHTLIGISSIPLGLNTARYHMWDGMRALDYLSGRLDIDANRLGCAGNSGGGTLTSYLMSMDERIAVAAPSCYITSMRALLTRQGPQDAEQNIHAQLTFGLTHADYILMRAPKPTLLCTATKDMFDIHGAWDTFREAKRYYARLGHPERVDLVETDTPHGYTVQLREGAVRWMRRWLMHVDDAITEGDFPIATDAECQVSEEGQVMKIADARSVFDLNADIEKQLAPKRKERWSSSDHSELLGQVRELAGVRPLTDLPKPRVEQVGVIERSGYQLRKLILRPEDGIALPVLAAVPENRKGPAVLYVDGSGKNAAAAEGGEIDRMARSGTLVVGLDLRGMGELYPDAEKSVGKTFGNDWKDWFLAYLCGRTFVGMRAEDILVTGRWLADYEAGDKPNTVRLMAIGQAGPPALHAAALEREMFARLDLRESVTSWSDVVQAEGAGSQLVNLVHGALDVYDLPDLVNELGVAKIVVTDPRDPHGNPVKE